MQQLEIVKREGHGELGNVEENVAGMANFETLGREVGLCCAMFLGGKVE